VLVLNPQEESIPFHTAASKTERELRSNCQRSRTMLHVHPHYSQQLNRLQLCPLVSETSTQIARQLCVIHGCCGPLATLAGRSHP
jgi:hypothetical protein